jgi:hypothetical protein
MPKRRTAETVPETIPGIVVDPRKPPGAAYSLETIGPKAPGQKYRVERKGNQPVTLHNRPRSIIYGTAKMK